MKQIKPSPNYTFGAFFAFVVVWSVLFYAQRKYIGKMYSAKGECRINSFFARFPALLALQLLALLASCARVLTPCALILFLNHTRTLTDAMSPSAVREKSKQLIDLLKDNELIREEREKARKLRDKYVGLGSGGGFSGGGYSGGYGGSSYSSGGGGYGGDRYGNGPSRYGGRSWIVLV